MARERAMPIATFLRNQPFDGEHVEVMGGAFAKVCGALGLSDHADQMTELIADHIIKLARKGIRIQTSLYLATVQEFKANAQ
jgi:hypothetical protein